MKKALITGITGQDGSYPAELLLEYEENGIVGCSSSSSDLELAERERRVGAGTAVSRHADS